MGFISFEVVAFNITDLMERILKVIKQKGEATPTEILNTIKKFQNVAQSTISRNIEQLKLAGLIEVRNINGKEKTCKLTKEGIKALNELKYSKIIAYK